MNAPTSAKNRPTQPNPEVLEELLRHLIAFRVRRELERRAQVQRSQQTELIKA